MTSCPYTTHQSRLDVPVGYLPITYCREGCGRTFFICARCQEANRPLTRYCRQCSEPLSFAAVQSQQEAVRPLQEGRSESYRLSEYGVTEVQALKTYKGLLIVVADQSVLLYDLHKIHEPLYQFHPPDRRVVRGVTFVTTDLDEELLITTSRSVYRLSLLTMQPDIAPVYEAAAGRYITQPVVFCAGQLYGLVLDERAQSSQLVRLPGDDVLSFDGVGRSLIRLTGDRFFFSTQHQVFLYDDGKVLQQRLPEQLAEADAAYSENLDTVYLVGESGLWRLYMSGSELTPVSLPTRVLGAPRLAAQGDHVYVAHAQGFLVLDPFGGVRWDSVQQFIRAEPDGLNPQPTEQYVLFTALGLNGGSDMRIHALNNWNDFKTHVYEQRLLCPPLLTLGRILSANGGAGGPMLGCTT
ncbi:MAG TPA: hypothetical protein VM911_23135 [Pyrinomonadaceae bacterium]|jgi:hypothetical protein|nr:hypothetical protein [Pyrinomonadaceae bacterium]